MLFPYMGSIGMCRGIWNRFQASRSLNRVSCSLFLALCSRIILSLSKFYQLKILFVYHQLNETIFSISSSSGSGSGSGSASGSGCGSSSSNLKYMF